MKTPAHQHKDLVEVGKCKLRVCGDYRAVNSQIAKIVPNLPTGLVEVEKAAGHAFYWESDSVACYSQFNLVPRSLGNLDTARFGPVNDPSFRTKEQWDRSAGTIPGRGSGNATRPAW
jgi:hypothetical protein